MKRFMRFAMFLAFLLITTQISRAQSVLEINQAASETTSELKQQIKFDSEQEDLIYRSYVLYNKKLSQIDAMSSANSKSALEEKKKVYTELCDNLKKILNKEQYARFEAFEKNKSN